MFADKYIRWRLIVEFSTIKFTGYLKNTYFSESVRTHIFLLVSLKENKEWEIWNIKYKCLRSFDDKGNREMRWYLEESWESWDYNIFVDGINR